MGHPKAHRGRLPYRTYVLSSFVPSTFRRRWGSVVTSPLRIPAVPSPIRGFAYRPRVGVRPAECPNGNLGAPNSYDLAGTSRWFRPEPWRRSCPHPRSALAPTRVFRRRGDPRRSEQSHRRPFAGDCHRRGRLSPDRPGSSGAAGLRARPTRRRRRQGCGRVGEAAGTAEALAPPAKARNLIARHSSVLRLSVWML
jgi:hypothetical protein